MTGNAGLALALRGEAPVPLLTGANIAPGIAVRLAVRTEDFVLDGGEARAVSGVVLVRSYLGQRTRLRLRRAGGEKFDVDLPSTLGLPREGETAHLGFIPGRIRLFAADSGQRLL